MSVGLRRGTAAAVATVAVLVLAALAIAAYHAAPRTGLQVIRRASVTDAARVPMASRNGPCLALPPAIRRAAVPLAFIDHGGLRTIDLGTCVERTLLGSGARAPVLVSADGRYVGSGTALVSSRTGGETQRPLGAGVWNEPGRSTWAWAPHGDRLAGITLHGAVILGRPGHEPVTLEPAGWGATSLVFDGSDAVIVVRGSRELWSIPLGGGPARLRYVAPGGSTVLQLATVQAGSAVVWRQPFVSASTAADGDLLLRVDLRTGIAHRLAGSVLLSPGYVEHCGPDLAVLAGGGRDATGGKRIVVFDPHWRARVVGQGVSPSCSANGRTVAFAQGRRERSLGFGAERRRIEVVFADGRRRTIVAMPSRGSGADEPILSADGRVVEWVQADVDRLARDGPYIRGALRAALTTGASHITGPIADLGTTSDYYGTLGWPATLVPAPR